MSFPYNESNHIPVSVMPERFRSIFPFDHFNSMQSESFAQIYNSDDNCVISSPTGSGKTVLFELALIKLLSLRPNDNKYLNSKAIYMAPTKALCKERYDDWVYKFQPLDCKVGLLTSDTTVVEMESVKRSNIIICTPEKWDAITRRWNDYTKLLDFVSLLLIDEVHFLRENRGTSLEVVVTRMKSLTNNLRIIALSATVPNIQDVSNWLTNSSNFDIQTNTLIYDDNYRAVKLNKIVYGYRNSRPNNNFQFDMFLNSKLMEVIKNHSMGKPVLIFCSTRMNATQTAKKLAQDLPRIPTGHLNFPREINNDLIKMIEHGVCYHHAGLCLTERKYIEALFKKGEIRILCSTSTLAVGVNLPAYLVIIKGTQQWSNQCMQEYSELDIMQMMGRAGRPQFETQGACVIMTDESKKSKYERLVKGTEKLESTLHLNIHEHITSEIVLGTISNVESAFTWLQSTFLYERFKANPVGYPQIFSKLIKNHSIDIQLQLFVKDTLSELIEDQLIVEKNSEYSATKFGETMSKNYVLYETMKLLIKSPPKMNIKSILELVSRGDEFNSLRMKSQNKRLYKAINENPLIMYPIKNKVIETREDKVNLIIQFELGGLEFPTFNGAMNNHYDFLIEKMMVFKNAPRILKAAIDVYIEKSDSITLLNLLKLYRCVIARTWETTSQVLKQFDGIGPVYAKKLMMKGIKTLMDANTKLTRDKLEYFLGLNPGSGAKMMKSIQRMPVLDLEIDQVQLRGYKVKFKIKVSVRNNSNELCLKWNGCIAHISVVTEKAGSVLDFRRLPLKKANGIKSFTLEADLQYAEDQIKVHLYCDEIAGLKKVKTIDKVDEFIKGLPCNSSSSTPLNATDNVNFNEFCDDDFSDDDKNESNENDIQKFEQGLFKEKDSALSSENLLNVRTTADISIINCNHKCPNKLTCRHYCCKHGIQRRSRKSCRHQCKDKSKCRHICCREQYKYENSLYSEHENQCTLESVLITNPITNSNNKPIEEKNSEITFHNSLAENIEPIDQVPFVISTSSDVIIDSAEHIGGLQILQDNEERSVIEIDTSSPPSAAKLSTSLIEPLNSDRSFPDDLLHVPDKPITSLPIFVERIVNKPAKYIEPDIETIFTNDGLDQKANKSIKFASLGRSKNNLRNQWKSISKKRVLDENSDELDEYLETLVEPAKKVLKRFHESKSEEMETPGGKVSVQLFKSDRAKAENTKIITSSPTIDNNEKDTEFCSLENNETFQTTIEDDKELLQFLGSDTIFE